MFRPRLHWTAELYMFIQYCGGVDAQTEDFHGSNSPKSQSPMVLQPSITSQVDDESIPIHSTHSRHSSNSSHFSSEELDALKSPFDSRSPSTSAMDIPYTIDHPSNCPLRDRSPIPNAKAHPHTEQQILSNHSSVSRNDVESQRQIDSDSELTDLPDSKEEIDGDDSDGLMARIESEEKELYTLKAMNHCKPQHRSISHLLHTPLSTTARAILGDPSKFDIPTSKSELFSLNRDLRKIKTSLEDIEDDAHCKYALMAILKHFQQLALIYMKYKKIGGNMDWLALKGWVSMMRDARLIRDDDDKKRFVHLFHRIYNDHHLKSDAQSLSGHSVQLSGLYGEDNFHDDDPWTGSWLTEDERNRLMELGRNQRSGVPIIQLLRGYSSPSGSSGCSVDCNDSFRRIKSMKLRKVGDRRIVGCINDSDFVSIRGSLMKSNFKKSRLDIRFKRMNNAKRLQSKRVMKCSLNAPNLSQGIITMKMKWEQRNGGSATTSHGQLKLFKLSGLKEDDAELPSSRFVGLSRHEFFDAILEASRLVASSKWMNSNDLCALCDRLVVKHLEPYIYCNLMDIREHITGNKMSDWIMHQMRLYNSMLVRLFGKYKSLDNVDNIHRDQWVAMAMDICGAATTHDRNVWSKGGKPTTDDMVHCFLLSKGVKELDEDEIEFSNFMRCLVYLAGSIYPNKPDTKYALVSFESKLDLVLKMMVTLECWNAGILECCFQKLAATKQHQTSFRFFLFKANDTNDHGRSKPIIGNSKKPIIGNLSKYDQ